MLSALVPTRARMLTIVSPASVPTSGADAGEIQAFPIDRSESGMGVLPLLDEDPPVDQAIIIGTDDHDFVVWKGIRLSKDGHRKDSTNLTITLGYVNLR